MPTVRFLRIPMAIAMLLLNFAGTGVVLASSGAFIPILVTAPVDDTQRVVLRGNTHPSAISAHDQGAVDPDLSMQSIRLVLKRSVEQESALEKFLAEQTDPISPNFHHWLTAQQFGALYGPADTDIEAVTDWLKSKGFSIDQISKGQIFIDFSGTAALVQQAFRTEMHHYLVNGQVHIANNGDPSIPVSLASVVVGVASLHDFFSKPLHTTGGTIHRSSPAGKWIPVAANAANSAPLFDASNGLTAISPYDFATIYNVLPLWNAGIDGSGQTLAIAGRSDVDLADIATFRSLFGLPPNQPNIIVNGADPGVPSEDDASENTLDLEWSGALAKGATIDFVTTKSTSTTDGSKSSALYIIDNKVAPVMSYSYGLCEFDLGSAGNAASNALWQQAAGEGITVMVASGDQGSAACDGGNQVASGGLQVSGDANTIYNVAVGGTDFNWINQGAGNGANFSQYWNSTNAANGSSALGYIPEVTWNSSCASTSLDQLFQNPNVGFVPSGDGPEASCQALLAAGRDNYFDVVGGGGGVSLCTSSTGSTVSSCSGGYSKPSWQTGTGVPSDGKRDLPDVSMFAANGALNNAYVICFSDFSAVTAPTCSSTTLSYAGGTSFSSPIMAGILALVNQKMASPQGNANVVFYGLAARDNRSSCNTNSVGAGNSCNFYDITTDDNAVPCVVATPNCNLATDTDSYGILTGYSSTVGYDLTTGLGSLNVSNVVNNWSLVAGNPTKASAPDVLGFTQAAAISAITQDQLAVGTVTTTSSSTIPSGDVISQSPAAGSAVALNSKVNLVISTGSGQVAVPNVVGLTQAAASSAITGAGLVVGTVTTQSSSTVASGLVISESPVAGTKVNTGSAVNLVVSSGQSQVAVPAVVGLTQAAASSAITGAGLVVGTVTTQTSSTVASGLVISESPVAGTKVNTGSAVNLVVSSGQSQVAVPAVVGLTQAAASSAITGAGLVVGTVTTQTSSTVASGLVISESPVAGTKVNTGSAVNLVVSSGQSQVAVPAVVGLTQAAASTAITGAGLVVGTVTTQSSSTVASGLVISESPVAGTKVNTGSAVNLVVSSGQSQVAAVTLSPTSVAFPTTALGSTSAAQSITLKNSGTATVTVSSIGLTGGQADDFTESNNCGATLSAGASCTISVSFKPLFTGAKTSSVAVTDNASGSPQTVALSGTGTAGGAAGVTLSPTSVAFPTTALGATSAAQSITLNNTGTATVTVSSIGLTGSQADDFAESNNCGATLAAGASCTISVSFKPLFTGAKTSSVAVTDNASGSPQTVALSGTGTAGGAAGVTFSPTSVAFPTTALGATSAAQSITLKNTGTATVTVSSIGLSGGQADDFTESNNCGSTLSAGASCTISVSFKPLFTGAKTSSVAVTDTASGSPQTVALSGTAQ